MEQPPADVPAPAAISYASPGTYRSPRRFTGIVVTSYIISTLQATFWISAWFVGVSKFADASRRSEDFTPSIVLIIVSALMTALAITLLVAASELRRLRPFGFRLHRLFAVGQLLGNIAVYILIVVAATDLLSIVALVPTILASAYPIALLALLKGQPNNLIESESPPTASTAASL
jgi:hypothetical protein